MGRRPRSSSTGHVAVELRSVHVPGGDVGARAVASVLVLGALTTTPSGRERGVATAADGDLGLLVGGQHEVSWTPRAAVAAPVIEIQDAARQPLCRSRDRGEGPAPVPPGRTGFVAEPAPNGHSAHFSYDPCRQDMASEFLTAEAGERKSQPGRQFTSQGFHERHDPRWEKQRVGLREDAPRGPRGVLGRSAFANCSR